MANPYQVKDTMFYVKNGRATCLDAVYLDIETSNNHAEDPKDLRTWIVSIQVLFKGMYFLFRTPEELIAFYMKMYSNYRLKVTTDITKKLITYIHNASYDLSYLIPYLNMLPDEGSGANGIIQKENKFITYVQGSFEFRCSFYLTGMSLENWSKEMNIEHKKAVGFYDYDKTLYPDSELTEEEQIYDKYDVLAMDECMDKQLSIYGDTLATVPFTKTGYIRRILRRSCVADQHYRENYFLRTKLTPRQYQALNRSYAGGYTHNNRFYTDVLVNKKVGHRDFKSHYPTQMTCSDQFPIGKFTSYYDFEEIPKRLSISDVLSLSPKFSTMTIIRITKAQLKDKNISMPFMQYSKCFDATFDMKIIDNGRVLKAEGDWVMYLDNFTLKILNEQYNMNYAILRVWRAINGRLPECVIKVIDDLFKQKSDLKNEVHKLTELYGKLDPRTVEKQAELQRVKALLNAIYGCCATNPLKNDWSVSDNMEFRIEQSYSTLAEIEEGLTKFYRGRNNFLPYQWGVWITAMARYELYEYIIAIGYDKCLYSDTDSLFYIKDEETEAAVAKLNAEKKAKAHYVVLANGKEEYYDEFSDEPDCIAFKGLHSKCYGVVTNKGLELTVAGVPARTMTGIDEENKPIYLTREAEMQGDLKDPIKALDRLTFGFAFKVNTGKTALYVGADGYGSERVPKKMIIDGHEVHTAGGCVIRKAETKVIREMDFTPDYEEDTFGDMLA